MKIALVTDAWQPQVNGVVTTLVELVRELTAAGHKVAVFHPGLFKTRPCPGNAHRGGVMHADLQQAFYGALAVGRHEARNRALEFSWTRSTQLFLSHLVPAHKSAAPVGQARFS